MASENWEMITAGETLTEGTAIAKDIYTASATYGKWKKSSSFTPFRFEAFCLDDLAANEVGYAARWGPVSMGIGTPDTQLWHAGQFVFFNVSTSKVETSATLATILANSDDYVLCGVVTEDADPTLEEEDELNIWIHRNIQLIPFIEWQPDTKVIYKEHGFYDALANGRDQNIYSKLRIPMGIQPYFVDSVDDGGSASRKFYGALRVFYTSSTITGSTVNTTKLRVTKQGEAYDAGTLIFTDTTTLFSAPASAGLRKCLVITFQLDSRWVENSIVGLNILRTGSSVSDTLEADLLIEGADIIM